MAYLQIHFPAKQIINSIKKEKIFNIWKLSETPETLLTSTKIIVILFELTLSILSALLAYYFCFNYIKISSVITNYSLYYLSLNWVIIFTLSGLYSSKNIFNLLIFLKKVPLLIFCQATLIISLHFAAHLNTSTLLFLIYEALGTILLLTLHRNIIFLLFKYRRCLFNRYCKVLIFGASKEFYDLNSYFKAIKVSTYVFDKCTLQNGINWAKTSNLMKIKSYCEKEQITDLILPFCDNNLEDIEKILEFTDARNINLNFLLLEHNNSDNDYLPYKIHDMYIRNYNIQLKFFDKIPIISLRKQKINFILNRLTKRAFDLIGSILLLSIVFIPLLVYLVFLSKFQSKTILFAQKKIIGRRQIVFKSLTFCVDLSNKKLYAKNNRNSFTKVLLNSGFNKCLKLINVISGDMSLVGPVPCMINENNLKHNLKCNYRYFAKPGIFAVPNNIATGLSNKIIIDQHMVMKEQVYIERWSLFTDFKIIFYSTGRSILHYIQLLVS